MPPKLEDLKITDVKDLKVHELKIYLKECNTQWGSNLKVTGNKEELSERLKEALRTKVENMPERKATGAGDNLSQALASASSSSHPDADPSKEESAGQHPPKPETAPEALEPPTKSDTATVASTSESVDMKLRIETNRVPKDIPTKALQENEQEKEEKSMVPNAAQVVDENAGKLSRAEEDIPRKPEQEAPEDEQKGKRQRAEANKDVEETISSSSEERKAMAKARPKEQATSKAKSPKAKEKLQQSFFRWKGWNSWAGEAQKAPAKRDALEDEEPQTKRQKKDEAPNTKAQGNAYARRWLRIDAGEMVPNAAQDVDENAGKVHEELAAALARTRASPSIPAGAGKRSLVEEDIPVKRHRIAEEANEAAIEKTKNDSEDRNSFARRWLRIDAGEMAPQGASSALPLSGERKIWPALFLSGDMKIWVALVVIVLGCLSLAMLAMSWARAMPHAHHYEISSEIESLSDILQHRRIQLKEGAKHGFRIDSLKQVNVLGIVGVSGMEAWILNRLTGEDVPSTSQGLVMAYDDIKKWLFIRASSLTVTRGSSKSHHEQSLTRSFLLDVVIEVSDVVLFVIRDWNWLEQRAIAGLLRNQVLSRCDTSLDIIVVHDLESAIDQEEAEEAFAQRTTRNFAGKVDQMLFQPSGLPCVSQLGFTSFKTALWAGMRLHGRETLTRELTQMLASKTSGKSLVSSLTNAFRTVLERFVIVVDQSHDIRHTPLNVRYVHNESFLEIDLSPSLLDQSQCNFAVPLMYYVEEDRSRSKPEVLPTEVSGRVRTQVFELNVFGVQRHNMKIVSNGNRQWLEIDWTRQASDPICRVGRYELPNGTFDLLFAPIEDGILRLTSRDEGRRVDNGVVHWLRQFLCPPIFTKFLFQTSLEM